MTDITIPPQAVEAAAISLMGKLMVSNEDAQHLWDKLYEPEKNRFRLEAHTAIRAAINAWPGMGPIRTDQPIGDWCDKLPAIILPLPQEKTDG